MLRIVLVHSFAFPCASWSPPNKAFQPEVAFPWPHQIKVFCQHTKIWMAFQGSISSLYPFSESSMSCFHSMSWGTFHPLHILKHSVYSAINWFRETTIEQLEFQGNSRHWTCWSKPSWRTVELCVLLNEVRFPAFSFTDWCAIKDKNHASSQSRILWLTRQINRNHERKMPWGIWSHNLSTFDMIASIWVCDTFDALTNYFVRS